MNDFKDFLFTIKLMRLVKEAKEAPYNKQDDYISQIISECYAHEMVKAMNGSPSTMIMCAVVRAFVIVYNHEKFKNIHDNLTAILNGTLKECMDDLEAADKEDND